MGQEDMADKGNVVAVRDLLLSVAFYKMGSEA